MEMTITIELIFALVTAVITAILGTILKDKVIPARFIPLQNLVIGLISAGLAIAFGLFNNIPIAIFTCLAISMGVGGTYDLTQTNKKQ